MNLLLFLLKMIVVSGILYSYYWCFLRNKKFHQYNRFYLLTIPVISICLPLLSIPIGLYMRNQNVAIKLLKVVTTSNWEQAVVITPENNYWPRLLTVQNMALIIFAIVVLMLAIRFLKSLLYLKRIAATYPRTQIGEINFYQTEEPGTPFSFLKNIFWNTAIDMNSEKGRQIFRHELYHVKQNHSTDILCIEMIRIVFWFNPFFYLVKKEIKTVHEFLADQYAASETNNHDYAELLAWSAVNNMHFQIANSFFNNQIKRRIAMLTQFKKNHYGYISRLMILPLLFILICAFAVRLNTKTFPKKLFANKSITIVVDAGHGGIFDGTRNNGIEEKDINLAIAKKIRDLGKYYNVKTVLTRDKDAVVGNATTLREDLQNRVNVAAENSADLFISLHVDQNDVSVAERSGFGIFVPKNINPNYSKSKILAAAISEELKSIYSTDEELKERDKGIIVIDKNTVPAIVIECGFINNKKDFSFITNPSNQENIARKILEGVVKYSSATQIPDEPKIEKTDTVQQPEKPYSKVEIEADYPGGEKAWSEYLMKNLKYPEDAVKRKIQGTVIVQFIVEVDGSLSDIKIFKRPDPSLSEVSYKVVKNSGKWVPAVQNGKMVRSYKRQPIVFKLGSPGVKHD